MKWRDLMLAGALVAMAGAAQAHTHLESATPADNAVLASAPPKVTLRFSEPARLTALTIQKEGEEASERIQGLPKEPSKELSAPLAPLGAGKYTLDWRALGADNHVMSGKLRFTVAAK
jgi:methionine-rich copper-binding protein CopC